MKTIYLERADGLVSYCKCERSLVSSPAQMDCPWCGCGWLFTCMTCHKAYTFARAVEVDQTLEELAEIDLKSKYGSAPTVEEIRGWVEGMRILLKGVGIEGVYAYIDGWYVQVHTAPVELEGWHSRHSFAGVPQYLALRDPALLNRTLNTVDYWKATEIAQPEGEE